VEIFEDKLTTAGSCNILQHTRFTVYDDFFVFFFLRDHVPQKDGGRKGRQNEKKGPKYSMNERCQQLLTIAINFN